VKICQGPKCHTYDTKDRLRGPKENKVPQTRRRSSFHYLGGNACDMRCERDWFQKFGEQAVNHFGRLTQPIKLEERNAWYKSYDYRGWNDNEEDRYYTRNHITKEQRPLTKQQYNDSNYTLNER